MLRDGLTTVKGGGSGSLCVFESRIWAYTISLGSLGSLLNKFTVKQILSKRAVRLPPPSPPRPPTDPPEDGHSQIYRRNSTYNQRLMTYLITAQILKHTTHATSANARLTARSEVVAMSCDVGLQCLNKTWSHYPTHTVCNQLNAVEYCICFFKLH